MDCGKLEDIDEWEWRKNRSRWTDCRVATSAQTTFTTVFRIPSTLLKPFFPLGLVKPWSSGVISYEAWLFMSVSPRDCKLSKSGDRLCCSLLYSPCLAYCSNPINIFERMSGWMTKLVKECKDRLLLVSQMISCVRLVASTRPGNKTSRLNSSAICIGLESTLLIRTELSSMNKGAKLYRSLGIWRVRWRLYHQGQPWTSLWKKTLRTNPRVKFYFSVGTHHRLWLITGSTWLALKGHIIWKICVLKYLNHTLIYGVHRHKWGCSSIWFPPSLILRPEGLSEGSCGWTHSLPQESVTFLFIHSTAGWILLN